MLNGHAKIQESFVCITTKKKLLNIFSVSLIVFSSPVIQEEPILEEEVQGEIDKSL